MGRSSIPCYIEFVAERGDFAVSRFVEEYVSRMKETYFVAVDEFMFLTMLLFDVTSEIFGLERTLLSFRGKRKYNKKSARNCKAPI